MDQKDKRTQAVKRSNTNAASTTKSKSSSDKQVPKKKASNQASSSKKKASNQGSSSKKKASNSKKKPTATKKASSKKQATTKKSVKAATNGAKVSAVRNATKKKPKEKAEPSKVKAVKRGPTVKKPKANNGRKLSNLEVRNAHAKARTKTKRIKFVKPTTRSTGPMIYDEAKYLKTLKKQGRRNLQFITIFFGIMFTLSVLFVARLEITHTKNGNDLLEYAESNYTETTSVESKRGTIYDTNGEALAINLEVYDLRAITDSEFQCNVDGTYQNCALTDTEDAATQMAKALDLGEDEKAYIKERLDYGIQNGKYEVSFGSGGKNITLSQKKALEKLNYPWLQFDAQELRFYPYGDFASYIIGYTTTDDNVRSKITIWIES